ncbi:MAG: hypothetical protein DMF25_10345 [Verrucomicrobia bacterium]|nr:MAG: hypothetical protein DMF25_10345 [Verrucomicrobiota bacterium]
MLPALSIAADGKSFAQLLPLVVVPGGGVGAVVGESNSPLKTGWFTNGPGGAPAAAGAGPTASQTFGILPNGGFARFVWMVEAVKKP